MIKVLIVDDSAVVRQVLTANLSQDPGITVIGAVIDPVFAMARMQIQWPDVIVLDVEMPRMDGLTFLEKLMRGRPMPVVMISSLTEQGSEATFRAMELGAVDFVAKPKLGIREGMQAYAEEICYKIKAASLARLIPRPLQPVMPVEDTPRSGVPRPIIGTEKLIAIGASTGGTEAIKDVLLGLPADSPGIVITQHMPPGFTRSFAERLNRMTRINVVEAKGGERILPGHAFLAPGDKHLLVERSGANYVTRLSDAEPVRRHKPAVDPMFHSVAQCAGRNVIACLLTGMGKDGAQGMLEIRQAGGYTVAQNEATCVVYGMPREAVAIGGAEDILPLGEIAEALLQQARKRGGGNRV